MISLDVIRKELMELNIAYPWPKMSMEQIEVLTRKWHKTFHAGHRGAFGKAVKVHVEQSSRFPTIGEVLAIYRTIFEREFTTASIPGYTYRQDQDEINRRGIAMVRAALANGKARSGSKNNLKV